jgi:hypothetical protein
LRKSDSAALHLQPLVLDRLFGRQRQDIHAPNGNSNVRYITDRPLSMEEWEANIAPKIEPIGPDPPSIGYELHGATWVASSRR